MVMAGFLLPIINKLMTDEVKKAPFSLILVPTAELAIQVGITIEIM